MIVNFSHGIFTSEFDDPQHPLFSAHNFIQDGELDNGNGQSLNRQKRMQSNGKRKSRISGNLLGVTLGPIQIDLLPIDIIGGNQKKKKPKPKPTQSVITTTAVPELSVAISENEWKTIERLKNLWESSQHTKSHVAQKYHFWVNRDAPYSRYSACLTPDNEMGHCHYVQHCPLADVINDFDTFLQYSCFIRNRYVGLCCPDSYWESEDTPSKIVTQRPRPKPITTTVASKYDPNDYNGVCGVSPNTRIVGGAYADPKEWLWMAALLRKTNSVQYCGGALISADHVLTAAHCLRGLTPNDVTVRLGAYDFSASADPESQDFEVENFRIHSKYDRYTHENDLAVITLKGHARFTENIKPICMPQRNRDYAGQLATVTGWGAIDFGGASSKQLRQVSIPVWNNTYCDAQYSQKITKLFLCAANYGGGKDACQGDSGGPLMLQGPNQRWMVIGVVSWGIKCGDAKFPGVYTRVSEFMDWIKNNTRL